MFGGKKSQFNPYERPAVDPEWEYCAVAVLGVIAFNEEVNKLAAVGWELVNGTMAGTANYAYMRRRISR